MPSRLRSALFLLALSAPGLSVCFSASSRAADAPFSLSKYDPPGPNKMHEPLAKEFSMAKAARALDSASLDWQKHQRCFTCHTNVAYLYARPLISPEDPAPQEIREALEKTVTNSFKRGRGLQDIYAVSAATALAINDSITTKKLHPLTKKALDHMWTVQASDGSMPWGGGPAPLGSLQFGAMITSIAVGAAPDGYAQTEAAKKGLARIRSWMEKHPPQNLHQEAMLLWASTYHDGYLTAKEKANIVANLRDKQFPDGGWSVPLLWKSKVQKGEEQDASPGDGYATGLCVYAMRRAGVPAEDPAIKKGIAWLKANQRESGRWFTRSLHRDGSNYLTNTGTAFAVMALQSCGESAPSASSASGKK